MVAVAVATLLGGVGAADAKGTRAPRAHKWHPTYHDHRAGAHNPGTQKYKLYFKCQTASCFKKHPSGIFHPHHIGDSQ